MSICYCNALSPNILALSRSPHRPVRESWTWRKREPSVMEMELQNAQTTLNFPEPQVSEPEDLVGDTLGHSKEAPKPGLHAPIVPNTPSHVSHLRQLLKQGNQWYQSSVQFQIFYYRPEGPLIYMRKGSIFCTNMVEVNTCLLLLPSLKGEHGNLGFQLQIIYLGASTPCI